MLFYIPNIFYMIEKMVIWRVMNFLQIKINWILFKLKDDLFVFVLKYCFQIVILIKLIKIVYNSKTFILILLFSNFLFIIIINLFQNIFNVEKLLKILI